MQWVSTLATLTFTGTVADLEQLNGGVLTCDDGAGKSDTVTIVIPGENITSKIAFDVLVCFV